MNHKYYLERALDQAIKAESEGQIPIGAVITNLHGEIIGSAHNQVKKLNDRTAHAEMLAIRHAIALNDGNEAQSWTIYSTLEPCPMCLGTIIMANIGTIVWASPDIHINTHELLQAIPYFRTRKINIVSSPYKDLEQKCKELHETYWKSNGRPDKIVPIDESKAEPQNGGWY